VVGEIISSIKRKGASIIFINDDEQVLLFLRDDKDSIPYPNMWDVPGGHVDPDESPETCIVREMKEEMDMDLTGHALVSIIEFDDRVEHTYWKKENLDIDAINLMEGQCLKWFIREEARKTELAYGFNQIIEDFYQKELYRKA